MNNNMKIIEIEQNTPEWLQLRKKYIGASDAPIIMGVSPWATPYMLWKRKLGLEPEQGENAAMKEGKLREEDARKKFIKETGIEVSPHFGVSSHYEWMCASYDGLSSDHKAAVEIKCPGRIDHEQALSGIIPVKYIPQLMHQMIVGGLESIFYFSFTDQSDKILELKRSDVEEELLLTQEKAFWECVNELKEPKLQERDFILQTDQEWFELSDEWKKVIQEKKMLEEKEEFLRNRIITRANNQNIHGNGLRVTRSLRKGTVDYKSIPQLVGIDLEKYRKDATTTWRFSA